MPDSPTEPAIDDSQRRRAGPPQDVIPLPTRLTRAYGLRHPFVGAGMGFIAHEQLAAAVTNAGGLGVLGLQILTTTRGIGFPYAKQVVRISRERVVTATGKRGVEAVYAIAACRSSKPGQRK